LISSKHHWNLWSSGKDKSFPELAYPLKVSFVEAWEWIPETANGDFLLINSHRYYRTDSLKADLLRKFNSFLSEKIIVMPIADYLCYDFINDILMKECAYIVIPAKSGIRIVEFTSWIALKSFP
jgi:hypothetical protein